MSAPIALALIALLVTFGVAWVIVKFLQEVRTRRQAAEPTYVIEDAIDFATEQVDPMVLVRIRAAGVQRIIEWSAYYLQGLADRAARRRGVTVVAGGEGNAIEYIATQLAKRGHQYSQEDVAAVLVTEGRYLASIGALGPVVDEAELA